MPRTATRLRGKLKDENDRARLARYAARDGRSIEVQIGFIIADWLDREDRKARVRETTRGRIND